VKGTVNFCRCADWLAHPGLIFRRMEQAASTYQEIRAAIIDLADEDAGIPHWAPLVGGHVPRCYHSCPRLAVEERGTASNVSLCWLVISSAGSQARLPPSRGSVIIARRDPVSRGLSQALSTACERG